MKKHSESNHFLLNPNFSKYSRRILWCTSLLFPLFCSCNSPAKQNSEVEQLPSYVSEEPEPQNDDPFEIPEYLNSIKGHIEQDTIVGNFTGKSQDTLYVKSELCKCDLSDPVQRDIHYEHIGIKYYMVSNNKDIPPIEIYGCGISPKLVNEGDLNGDGTCEVGYVYTWMTSQWRYYRIFTLVGNEWRYLIKGDFLNTPLRFRYTDYEVAEPGPT
ncbi:MAG: hypothetical protein ACRC9Q_01770, partial [Bacteroidales bacterium]